MLSVPNTHTHRHRDMSLVVSHRKDKKRKRFSDENDDDSESDETSRCGPFLMTDLQWPEVRMDQCVRALDMCGYVTIRSAIDTKYNALLGRGVIMKKTPHIKAMSESVQLKYNTIWEKFLRAASIRADAMGIIPITWLPHPCFKAIPVHLDVSCIKIRRLQLADGRVIHHVYDMSGAGSSRNGITGDTMTTASSQMQGGRRIWNAHVFELHAPDRYGNIRSKVMSLLPHFEYFMQVRQTALSAYHKQANPVMVLEHEVPKYTDESITSASDLEGLQRQINQASEATNSGSSFSQPSTSGVVGLYTDMDDKNTVKRARATTNPAVQLLSKYLNSAPPDEIQNFRDTERMDRISASKDVRLNRITLDPGKVLVSNHLQEAKAPDNVQEVEIAFLQMVYEAFSIPRTMVTSEGSKTSTNENAQRVFDDAQTESVRFLKLLAVEVYNAIHKNANLAEYYEAKAVQYNDMKAYAYKRFREERILGEIYKQFGPAGAMEYISRHGVTMPRFNETDETEKEEEEDHEDAWKDLVQAKFDAYFAATCTQQEIEKETDPECFVVPGKPVDQLLEWYSSGLLNWEGVRSLFMSSTGVPEEFVEKEEVVDREQLAGTKKPTDPNASTNTSGGSGASKRTKKK
jgi:hypothetical protein